ncbi:hypothetical protein Pst134EA_025551 [Puccinia striiformis f. sp. tritici]|uniref:hypothetical protein n=1 Tax=Puccinia striiformis f. sp. tritici TaxID=168172 RepID=UPI0020077CD2|nr:hypothetical protein Pst134EA_025551 [Puccinia striiformis f. sp. tritici]KAH9451603.1 hypothetical protein Pst134EA_025551 [Puccinia striiformis f. sp. tritici]
MLPDLPVDAGKLSQRQKRNLRLTAKHSNCFPEVSDKYVLRLGDNVKKETFSIQEKTFNKSNYLIVTDNSANNVHFLVQFHPLATDGHVTDPDVGDLVEMIRDLYVMSTHRPHLDNKWTLHGKMSCIGFRGASEGGKTAGVYAWKSNITEEEIELDAKVWSKLSTHNKLVCKRLRHFSEEAYEENKQILAEFGVPSWSAKQWNDISDDSVPLFPNVSVTTNDFYNQPHEDTDKNTLTYGIFSYVSKTEGNPILPPSNVLGHALRFPKFNCNIDFGATPGLIEVLWQSNDLKHHTTSPPEALKTTSQSTHFGSSFQISHPFIKRAEKVHAMPEEKVQARTVGLNDCLANWAILSHSDTIPNQPPHTNHAAQNL